MFQAITTTIPVTISCGLVGFAVFTDMRAHRIPNWLVLGILLASFTHQLMAHGFAGLLYGVGGLAVGIGAFLAFYIGRGMGAGDVKLMGAVGAMLGPLGALLAVACSLIAGLIMVLGARQLTQLSYRYAALRAIPELFVQKNDAVRVPYAPAIAAGYSVALWQTGTFSTLALVAK
jgi:prepilin peptidase CpaA